MEVVRLLGRLNPVAGNDGQIYLVGENKGCVISSMNICNTDVNDATIRIALIRDISADIYDYLEYNMVVYGNCSAQRLKGVTLAQGDIIVCWASSNNINFHLFGSEFDQSYEYA